VRLTLCWRGPVGPGCFPEDEDALARLAGAGVYLRIKSYDGGRTVRYVGRSVRLLSRFDQHLRDVLTFSSALRDDAGHVALARDAVHRVVAYNALEDVLALVAAEARRMRFFYALAEEGFDADWLGVVEGALKARIETRLDDTALGENVQPIPLSGFDEDFAIESDLSALDAAGRDLLGAIIGAEDIRLPTSSLELGHAE